MKTLREKGEHLKQQHQSFYETLYDYIIKQMSEISNLRRCREALTTPWKILLF